MVNGEERAEHRNHREDARRGHAGEHIRVRSAVNDAGGTGVGEQVWNLEIGVHRQHRKERRSQEREMPPGLAGDRHAAALGEIERAGQHVARRGADDRDDDHGQRHLLRQVEHREAEDIETESTQNRIADAERRPVVNWSHRIHSLLAATLTSS
jgi:hypothetical protein